MELVLELFRKKSLLAELHRKKKYIPIDHMHLLENIMLIRVNNFEFNDRSLKLSISAFFLQAYNMFNIYVCLKCSKFN